MPRDAHTFIELALSEGVAMEDILQTVMMRLETGPSQPTLPPAGATDTVSLLDEVEAEPSTRGISLSPELIPDAGTPRLHGLERYDDLGPLGMGGMGEVRRVRDRRLGRIVAFKTIRPAVTRHPSLVARFLEEAQATAQLQHPGILPVYDLGELPDGRLWFTMKEVSGKRLGDVIAEVHAASDSSWRRSPTGWTLRRLVDTLRQVCEAVGYAHGRGVVHRDLKPDNVMVGEHGEVVVLDWGLVKVLGHAVESSGPAVVETHRSRTGALATQSGQVAGTPAFMPPEQAVGAIERIGARSDVYSLGAMLYTLLAGHPPYTGHDARAVLDQVRSSPPAPLTGRIRPLDSLRFGLELPDPEERSETRPLPPELVTACETAMARQPGDRYASASELARELQAWLDGSRREEEALAIVASASERAPQAEAIRQRAHALRSEARQHLEGIAPWRPETDKLEAWTLLDTADELDREAELEELAVDLLLAGSLTHAPELPAAHAALLRRYRHDHEEAEAAGRDTHRLEQLFRQHLASLPDDHDERPDHLSYLQGDGALTLVTDPPGAEVLLYRYERHNRRRRPRFVRSLGQTPLRGVSLPMGSYLCVLRHPARVDVRYPVCIRRREHWDGRPPGSNAPHPIRLPRPGELGPHDHYVPAGWFQSGGDPKQDRCLPGRRVWVDGRVFRRFPVTNRDYIQFLDALVADQRTEDALQCAPRERGGSHGDVGPLIYGFDGRRFFLQPDFDGDCWELDWPVCMIDWNSARAFARWTAHCSGQAWRLPGELAWEKAARGVDGRFFPWGDAFDPSWTCMRLSHEGAMLPAPIDSFPVDTSVYGIRGLAGNMATWCLDAFADDGPPLLSARQVDPCASDVDDPTPTRRVQRGGGWLGTQTVCRSTLRRADLSTSLDSMVGVRLARSYP